MSKFDKCFEEVDIIEKQPLCTWTVDTSNISPLTIEHLREVADRLSSLHTQPLRGRSPLSPMLYRDEPLLGYFGLHISVNPAPAPSFAYSPSFSPGALENCKEWLEDTFLNALVTTDEHQDR